MIRWKICPILHEPRRKSTALLICVFLIFALCVLALGWGYGIAALVFLLLSLRRYFFPTTYEVSEKGVRQVFWGMENFRSLENFERVIEGENGVFLSPFAQASRLDPFRGVFLRYPIDHEERERVKSGVGEIIKRFQ